MKKVGKTTRPFKYDLNQIPYDYTVEVTKRFKGLDLIEYVKNYGQRFVTLYRRQGSRPSPRKRNAKKQKHKLESRLLGEILITSNMQMTLPLWQTVKKNYRAS